MTDTNMIYGVYNLCYGRARYGVGGRVGILKNIYPLPSIKILRRSAQQINKNLSDGTSTKQQLFYDEKVNLA